MEIGFLPSDLVFYAFQSRNLIHAFLSASSHPHILLKVPTYENAWEKVDDKWKNYMNLCSNNWAYKLLFGIISARRSAD
jgi:hypothetical protein